MNLATGTAAVATGSSLFAAEKGNVIKSVLRRPGQSAIDKINIALIGAGGMGVQDTITALQVPGTKLVAVCDLYEGRLAEAKTRSGWFANRSEALALNVGMAAAH